MSQQNHSLYSQSEIARRLNVSRQAIHQHVKAGRLALQEGGLIRLSDAEAMLDTLHPTAKTLAHLRAPAAEAAAEPPAAPAPAAAKAAPDASLSYHVVKTMREAAEAKMAALRLAEMERKLIDKDRAHSGAFTAFRQLRDALGVLPRRLAPGIAAKTDVREIEDAIAEAVRDVLDLFATRTLPEMLRGMGAPDFGGAPGDAP